MRNFITALLLTSFSQLVAQVDSTEREPFYGDHFYVRMSFGAGITNINPAETNRTLFNSGGFSQLITLGLEDDGSIEPLNEKGYFGYDFVWSVHWYLADKIKTHDASGNQMQYALQGWEFMSSVAGIDLFANRNFDFIIAPGSYWGNLKLYQRNLTDTTIEEKKYMNPFIGPMGRAEIRVNFGPLTIGSRFSYRYDITNAIWQRRSQQLDPLPGYKFRDTQFLFYIGLRAPFV